MKKTTRQRKMNPEPARQRKLALSRETVRMLDSDELLRAVGGDCVTTSFTSDRRTYTC
jgi:hypothetical protein